ncbi:MAG: serine/threonine protein kinase, partial [Polyangiaceae bacterium]|nr:serine/threonine protein kinase [Polyangiaceae bacterium]
MTDHPPHPRAHEADPAAPNAVVASKYRVVRALGSGGMGVVVEVEHLEFPRRFALKWIRPDRLGPEAEQRFKREAVVTGSLCHENLVSIVDFGRCDDGAAYMV